MVRVCESCVFSDWLWGHLTFCSSAVLMGGFREDGARLLSEVHSKRVRGSGLKLH